MRRANLLRVVCLAGAWLAVAAATASAQSPITDCSHHSRLTRPYTTAQLQNALATMPPATKEYTACYTVIQAQLFRQLGERVPGSDRSVAGGSNGSSTPWVLIAVVIAIVVVGGGLALAAGRRRGGGGIPPSAAAG